MKMKMLSPKVDYAFKRIFGNNQKPEILIGFLNDFLQLSGAEAIHSIEYKNPINDKKYDTEKLSVMDVKAETNNGEIINIEIQIHPDRNMIKRSLFYWARMFAEQSRPQSEAQKDNYRLLKKAISIIIMDYCLEELEGQGYHSIYELYERSTKEKLTDALELHYVELPKFKIVDQKQCDIWLEFLNNPLSLLVKEEMKTNQPLDMAYGEIYRMSLSEEERGIYFAREKALADQNSRYAQSHEDGYALGLEEGQEKQRIEDVAVSLKKGMDKETIIELFRCSEQIFEKGLKRFQEESKF